MIQTDWAKIGDRGVPGAFLVTFSASKKSLAPRGETPLSRGRGGRSPHNCQMRLHRTHQTDHPLLGAGICLDTDSTTPTSTSWMARAVPP